MFEETLRTIQGAPGTPRAFVHYNSRGGFAAKRDHQCLATILSAAILCAVECNDIVARNVVRATCTKADSIVGSLAVEVPFLHLPSVCTMRFTTTELEAVVMLSNVDVGTDEGSKCKREGEDQSEWEHFVGWKERC